MIVRVGKAGAGGFVAEVDGGIVLVGSQPAWGQAHMAEETSVVFDADQAFGDRHEPGR